MYDWQRREQTNNLLRHDVYVKSNVDSTPLKQKAFYPYHHLNLSPVIIGNDDQKSRRGPEKPEKLENEEPMKSEKKINVDNIETKQRMMKTGKSENQGMMKGERKHFFRTNTTLNHSPIFTQAEESSFSVQKQKICSTNSYVSNLLESAKVNLVHFKLDKEQNEEKIQSNKQVAHVSSNPRNRSSFSLNNKMENSIQQGIIVHQKKYFEFERSQIFTPSNPQLIKQTEFKIKDHSIEDLFGDEPRIIFQRPVPQPFEPIYKGANESASMKMYTEFYAHRNDQGDLSKIEQRCLTTENESEDVVNIIKDDGSKTPTKKGKQKCGTYLTPQMRRQLDNIGKISDFKDISLLEKNKEISNQFREELRSNKDTWLNKIECPKNNQEKFLNNGRIAEQQKFQQLKSDFFEEINMQIFGGKNSSDIKNVASEGIGLPQQEKSLRWIQDNKNEDKKHKDIQYSDLFGYGEKVLPHYQQNHNKQEKEEAKKNKQEANAEEKYYYNLSSYLDEEGYRNHYLKNNNWKKENKYKFINNKLIKNTEDNQQIPLQINFGCPKNDDGKSSSIIELPFSNFSEKFDQTEFKKYCAEQGIHLIDISYEFNKINNKLGGPGSIKIRDFNRNSSRLEDFKDHLRSKGLILKNSPITSLTEIPTPQRVPLQSVKEKAGLNFTKSKGLKLINSKKINSSQTQVKDLSKEDFSKNTFNKMAKKQNQKSQVVEVTKKQQLPNQMRTKSTLLNRRTLTEAE